MWTVTLPLSVAVSRKKKFILNLNRYRNSHFHLLNKAKAEFERVVGPLVGGIPRLAGCSLEYVLYSGGGARPDTNNVCSVQDKFFQDTLVRRGVLGDDGPDFVLETRFRFGGRDPLSPRVEVTISPARAGPQSEGKRRIMATKTSLIEIPQSDVELAIRDFIRKNFPEEKADEMELVRGDDGGYEARGKRGGAPKEDKRRGPRQPKPEAESPKQKEGEAQKGQEADAGAQEGTQELQSAQPEVPQAPEPAPAQPSVPVTKAGGGLFGNLKKPVS